jgi:S1-C subfamily serine protease
VAQIRALSQARKSHSQALDIVAADGKDGNAHFLRPLQGQHCGLVQQVFEGSPADRAGLRGSYKAQTLEGQHILVGGDVIVAVDGTSVKDLEELHAALPEILLGEEFILTILRNGRQIDITISIEALL